MPPSRSHPLPGSSPSPADTSGVHVWLVLMKAHCALARHAEQSIAELGFGLSDFGTLEILLHKRSQSVTEIAHRIGLTAGSMSIALDRLEKRGLVQRHAHPTDRRNRLIRLTAAGKKLIQSAFRDHALVMENVATSLTSEDRSTLVDLLKRLGKGAEQLLQQSREQEQPRRENSGFRCGDHRATKSQSLPASRKR